MPAPQLRVRLTTHSPEETEALGRRLGARLQPGDVVALVGPLGAGKTVLARGIAAGCGAQGYVASPSFVVIREYAGRVRVYHADLFRLDRLDDIHDLGLADLDDGVLVVEWADRAGGLLPGDQVRIECAMGKEETERIITLDAPAVLADRVRGLGAPGEG